MSSQIEIVNLALLELGQAQIASLTEGTTAAITMNAIYDIVRRELLRKYRWSFSRKQANLSALVADPIWEYSHSFQLPADFIQLIQIKNLSSVDPTYRLTGTASTTPAYRIFASQIYVNDAGPLYIEYVADIEDTTLFDAAFATTFALALAARSAQRITQSSTVAQLVEGRYMQSLREAVRANAIEVPSIANPSTSYTIARVNGG